MKYLLVFIVFISLTSCYQTTRNCKDFKTGTFYSEITINDTLYKAEFSRTTDLQIETYKGHVDSSKVRWINDCEVVFKTINPKNMAERKDIHLKIMTTTDSSYTYEYSYVGDTKKQKGVAFLK